MGFLALIFLCRQLLTVIITAFRKSSMYLSVNTHILFIPSRTVTSHVLSLHSHTKKCCPCSLWVVLDDPNETDCDGTAVDRDEADKLISSCLHFSQQLHALQLAQVLFGKSLNQLVDTEVRSCLAIVIAVDDNVVALLLLSSLLFSVVSIRCCMFYEFSLRCGLMAKNVQGYVDLRYIQNLV